MTSSKFAVVICHGSYHTPAPYQALIDALEAHGIETHCPQRPTCDLKNLNIGDPKNPDFDRPPPENGYPLASEDATTVGNVIDKLISANKLVLLVAHSSGGWVACEAAISARQAPVRKAQGQSGGVIGIFFVGAFIIPLGESIDSFFQPKDGLIVTPIWLQLYASPMLERYACEGQSRTKLMKLKYGHEGVGTITDPVKYLFNDIEPVEAEKWAAALSAAPIPRSPLTNDLYSGLPCAYLVLENDMTLPKQYQEGMIAAHNAVNEKQISILRCQASHSPHISWTVGLRDEIEKFGTQALAEV
ncbi:hypothetical protein N7478_009850 [Penicillium angulare]|uniref:uncharacterized protein n=1 Tax=Penicillium angulare TaxID=116970 RepID=UPI00253F8D77|nr:uncharacterized protein N7478_009850 [Penicillium angulare]KAJ5267042.1 hypothetical protein N7478_009850 [Penicillium angulare]